MTNNDKIVEYLIARLKDKRSDVRLNAIHDLEALGAEAAPALDALKECHDRASEADEPEISGAARNAGFNIFMAVKQSEKASG